MKTATLPANTLMPDYSTGKSSLPSLKQKTQNLKAELKKEILKLVVKDFIAMDNKWKRNSGHFETQTLAIYFRKLNKDTCYNPGPYHQFSAIFHHLFLHSQSLVPHSFPYVPLGLPPNHLTSHLMDHLTIPQSDITCHHSAVRSTPQHHYLTLYGLPAHCHVMMNRQLMMELYLELPAHDEPYYT